MGRIVSLWTSPRSVSTAIYKSFDQRSDTSCSYEPYNDCFYFSSERQSSKYGDRLDRLPYTGNAVFDQLQQEAEATPILFVKDMAFMALPYITDAQLNSMTNAFIIRHPAKCLRSIKKVKPDFDRTDFGYVDLGRMFTRITEDLGQSPIVIDGDRVASSPFDQLEKLCAALGLPFEEQMLTWSTGHVRDWKPYELKSHERWHKTLITTAGFRSDADEPADDDLAIEHRAILDEALPIYERLRKNAL